MVPALEAAFGCGGLQIRNPAPPSRRKKDAHCDATSPAGPGLKVQPKVRLRGRSTPITIPATQPPI